MSSTVNGSSSGEAVNTTLYRPSLSSVIRASQQYGTEAGVGGDVTKKSTLIDLLPNQQVYNLESLISAPSMGSGKNTIEVRRIFYEATPAIMRYFDPYAGTGTGIQSIMDAFDFGSMSPGVNFLLMPASYDVLKTQAIEFNDQIRKAGYSFEISNNILTLFPIPKSPGKLRVEYYELKEKSNKQAGFDDGVNLEATAESGGSVGGSGGSTSSTGTPTNISNVNAQNLILMEITT